MKRGTVRGRRPRHAAVVAATFCAVLAVAGCGSSGGTPTSTAQKSNANASAESGGGLRGLIPTPMPVKPTFTLPDTAGKPYDFDAQTRGKLTYLFFGYTH